MNRDGHRVPDFFIVGQAKSGTTALYEMLRQHPGVFLPDLKEPEFLASDLRRSFQPAIGGSPPDTLNEYLALFDDARADQCIGEASAFYLSSRVAARSIAALNPKARIIALFREPSSFLRSLHLQLLRDHLENQRDLRVALELETSRRRGRSIPRRSYRPQVLHYSEHVCYAEQLARYHSVFPREQVLVLIYEEFRRDNAAALHQIMRFLELDDSQMIAPVRANPTVALRSQVLDDVVHRYSVGRGPAAYLVKTGLKTVLPHHARRRLLRTVQTRLVHAAPPPPDETLMGELRKRLKPEVDRLSKYLGRDLVTLWGYDHV